MFRSFLGRLSKRERIGTIVVSIVLFAMLMDRLVLGPMLDKMESLDKMIADKEKLLRADMRILSYKNKIAKETKLYEKYSLRAVSSGDEKDEIAFVLKEIENLASEAGISTDALFSGTRKEGLLKVYRFKVDCESDMEKIIRFMHTIENSKKLLRIKSVRMRPKERGSEITECSLVVEKIVMPE